MCRHNANARIHEKLDPIMKTLLAESKGREGQKAAELLHELQAFDTLAMFYVFNDMTEELQNVNLNFQKDLLTTGGKLYIERMIVEFAVTKVVEERPAIFILADKEHDCRNSVEAIRACQIF